MGIVKGISVGEFPKQGNFLHCTTEVCFNYDSSQRIGGIVVREDAEEPGIMIIRLDDGRYVLSTECQYKLPRKPASDNPDKREK
jgi:hypothetical protein